MASRGKGMKVYDEFDYDEEEVLCDCGLRASRRISHTTANPNRKFFGCPKFTRSKDNRACDFFEWYDVRFAVFKATRMLAEMVVKSELENKELRASLDKFIQNTVCASPTNEVVPSCCRDVLAQLEVIKERLERLELGAIGRK